MKFIRAIGVASTLCLSAMPLLAQEASEVEQLRRQLKQLQEQFEKQQQLQRQQIDVLQKQIEALQQKPAAPPATVQQAAPPREPQPPAAAPTSELTAKSWSPAQPITLARAGSAYMNVSFDTLINFGWSSDPDVARFLNLGDHDPLQRGFSLRNAEISLDGAVDPYFKGFANIVFKLDKDNATAVELEEAFLQSSSLPGDLQLKVGQFFANFGRQNPQHPHQWAFVDQPLILNRAFGPDGLRSVGAQASWLAPLPFYTELFFTVMNGNGSQAFSFRNRGDANLFFGRDTFDRQLSGPASLLYLGRLSSSFDLTDTQTLLVGASSAFGPNDTGLGSRTEIYGTDLYWKWKSPRAHEGFPFVSWQTEALYRRFGAGADPTIPLPAENLVDYGFYSQLLWGIKPRWVLGMRGEYVSGDNGAADLGEPFRNDRTRLSPNLTWYPSEFSKIRLQYNYDRGQIFPDAHSVWLQMEFLLGAHAAHKF